MPGLYEGIDRACYAFAQLVEQLLKRVGPVGVDVAVLGKIRRYVSEAADRKGTLPRFVEAKEYL